MTEFAEKVEKACEENFEDWLESVTKNSETSKEDVRECFEDVYYAAFYRGVIWLEDEIYD